MSGFSVLIGPDSDDQTLEAEFQKFLGTTLQFKKVEKPAILGAGRNCLAAKLDSTVTLHPGIIHDQQTGSWLLAAGTVVALEGDNHPQILLQNLLRDYIEYGSKALGSYDGSFALVIYNGRDESLAVVSDAIGLFGIFYGRRGNQIFISSSAFTVARQIQSQPDVLSAEQFLRTGRLDGDRTLWQDVKRLPGGTVLHAIHGHVEKTEYWSPTFDHSINHLPFYEALERCVELLTRSFSRMLAREGKTWVDLTGGFDSRLVAMIVDKNKAPFSVYCMGPENHPDVRLSRKISQEMGWEYENTQLPEQWESECNTWFDTALGWGDGRTSILRLAVTMRGFNQRNTVVRTNVMGVGGENFRGYRWQVEGLNIGRTSKVNYEAWLDNIFAAVIPIHIMRADRTKEVRRELYDFIIQLCSSYAGLPNCVQIDRFEIGRDSGLGGAYLSAVAGMQRSLIPLHFKELINFSFSLNYRWRLPWFHVFERVLMERENSHLASLDTTTGGPAVPIRFTNIPKFRPLWRNLGDRAVAIGSHKLLGKTVHVWPRPPEAGYPLPSWQKSFSSYARAEGMLNYDRMCSAGLYNARAFKPFIEQDGLAPSHPGEFLDHVITIEMAMRAVGSTIE